MIYMSYGKKYLDKRGACVKEIETYTLCVRFDINQETLSYTVLYIYVTRYYSRYVS